jgi:hypothetical protein
MVVGTLSARRPGMPVAAIAGWLFADLLLAFAVIMLGTQQPPPPRASVTRTPTPSPSSTRTGLERQPVTIEFSVTPDDAANKRQQAVTAIRKALGGDRGKLAGRRAGMVLTFGSNGSPGGGEDFANAINLLLSKADGSLFGDVTTRNFHDLSAPVGSVRLDIYLFVVG